MDREVKPQQYIKKSKFLNKIDETLIFMCIHISKDLLFLLEGVGIAKEVWDKLESFFEK